jgi:hypothetical protein
MPDRTFTVKGDEVEVHTQPCMGCNKREKLTIPKAGYDAWIVEGEYIQVALPDLTPEERELILTGIHPKCWDDMFPEED